MTRRHSSSTRPAARSDHTLSPDGKYFFYCANGDVYWVSAKVLERYRPR